MLLEEEVAKRQDIVLSTDWTKIEYLKCLYFSRFDIPEAVKVGICWNRIIWKFPLFLPKIQCGDFFKNCAQNPPDC